MKVLVVHPPVSVAKDFIDYPYFSNLGAVQLAAVLREHGHEVVLLDSFSTPTKEKVGMRGERLVLGALPDEIPAADVTLITYGPFHRPPNRDEVLAETLQRLPGPKYLVDAYQSGQHYVDASEKDVFAAYPEVHGWVKYEAEVSVPKLLAQSPLPTGMIRGEQAKLDALPLPAWDSDQPRGVRRVPQ
ncbi:MAG: hypothetical protein QM817_35555 [Archangium sp.]